MMRSCGTDAGRSEDSLPSAIDSAPCRVSRTPIRSFFINNLLALERLSPPGSRSKVLLQDRLHGGSRSAVQNSKPVMNRVSNALPLSRDKAVTVTHSDLIPPGGGRCSEWSVRQEFKPWPATG